MRGTRLGAAAISAIVFLVFAEAVSLAIYFARNGTLFYTNRPVYDIAPESTSGELTADRLHPYFGATHKPGHPFHLSKELGRPTAPRATNNFGFVSPLDYPFARTNPYQFIIGVFGGSVGVWFCQLGVERFIEDLKQHPFFSRRDPIVLCFSHEGYKQPQQLLVLAYFLAVGQEFDLVVNIDGFNEVAIGRLNDQRGLDISMPSVMHMDPLVNLVNQSTLTPAKLESLADISRYRRRLNGIAERINGSRLASVSFVLEQLHRIGSTRLAAEQARFAGLPSNPSESSLIQLNPRTRERAGPTLFEDIARSWIAASRLMHDLLSARSVPYVHVLQPNQYHSRRRFEREESAVALNAQSPFKEGVERGYPALLAAAAATTRDTGFTVLDATAIFDRESSAVYIDDCCHYTLTGNRILADHIAAAVVSSGRLKERAGSGR